MGSRDIARRTDRIIIAVLVVLTCGLIWWLAASNNQATQGQGGGGGEPHKVTYQDYDGKKIGILTGTNMEAESLKRFPKSEYLYFDGYPGLNAALENGIIDAYLGDEPALKSIHAQQPQIDYIRERLSNNQYSFAFRKNDPAEERLRDQFNEFLRTIKADGTYAAIDATWFGTDESKKVVDLDNLPATNGTLRIVMTPTDEPFCYMKDGKHVGYDVDVAARFCKAYGYALQIGDVDFQARIPALESGMYDCTNTMNVTPEREESVLFSEAVSEGGIVVAVRAQDLTGEVGQQAHDAGNPIEHLAQSFEKNFIREDRWRLILQGLATTCLITASSVALGSILSLGICLFRRTGSRLANIISDAYVRLLQGTPTVVLLMILYYVVLGRSGLDAVWVAVIGFTLNFGAYGSEIMRSAIEGVSPGQREAALALGYSEGQAFRDFIFPQAAVRFLPVLRGEMINLLKSTSVVGYIAIQDLTKMSDIIRSRTYEAFFPLVTTALIYFALAWVLAFVMRRVLLRVDPRKRRENGREAGAR